jgi:hypothetical protein
MAKACASATRGLGRRETAILHALDQRDDLKLFGGVAGHAGHLYVKPACGALTKDLTSLAVPQFPAQCPDAFVAKQRVQRGGEDNGVVLVPLNSGCIQHASTGRHPLT